ncbi:MAG TPA: PKD domain-containing protein, partial [Methylococcales bacterium]
AAKAAYAFQDACSGNATTFDNLSQNNNTTIKSYLWNFGNSGSASDTTTATNPKYNYKLAGEYNVKLVVTNTLGCTDTIAKKVTIFASPAADFNWNTECEAKPVHFSDISEASSVAITNWNWKFSSEAQILDASTKKSCNVSFAHAGTYDANLKVTDRNGCSTLVAKQITIKPSPVAAFSIADNYENKQGQVLINNGTLNGTDYEWDFGNGKSSTAETPIVTFDREGHYTIQLIAWNGPSCADTLTMAYDLMFKGLYVPNALNPGNMDPEVAVFRPKGVNLKSYLVEIYDRWGTLLWSSTRINSKGSPEESWDGTLHGEALKEGVYVWKIAAQFNDGEVWDGTNSGNNQNMPQKKSGTVTLIR